MHINKLPIILGVTGHRNIGKIDYENLKVSVRKIFDYLEKEYSSTPIVILSPLADGADRLVVEVSLESKYKDKINTIIPLPFNEDIYIQTFGKGILEKDDELFNQKSLLEYENLKNMLKENNSLQPSFIEMEFDRKAYDNANEEEKQQIRRIQYSKVGEYVAIHSNILIALENINSEKKEGGTSEIVEKKLHGNYKYFFSENTLLQPEKGLVYRINTPRKGEDLKDKYKILKLFPKGDTFEEVNWEEKNKKLDWSISTFKYFVEELFSKPCLNSVKSKKYNEFKKNHVYLNCLNSEINKLKENGLNNKSLKQVEFFQKIIGIINKKNNNKIKILERYILVLLAIISVIVVSKSFFNNFIQDSFTVTYPLIILILYILIIRMNKYKSLSEDTRAILEGLRVQEIWNKLGIMDCVAFYYSIREKDQLNWIRSTLRTLNIYKISNNCINESVKKDINRDWINEQIKYFSKKIKDYRKIEERYDFYIKLFVILIAILTQLVGIISVFKLLDSESYVYIIIKILLSIFLFLLTMLKAKQFFNGYDRLIKQYEISLGNFERAYYLVSNEKISDSSYINIIKKLGQEALIENTYWIILRRERKYKAHL